jgi:apolipoprotein N-acyltransferase
MTRQTKQNLALCVLAGVLYFLSFLSFDLFPLTWICFVPVLYAIRDVSPRRALLLGWLFGFVTNAGGFYWVVHLISEFGGIAIPFSVLGFALLCVFQGFLMALVVALVRHAQLRLRIAPVWSLPVALVALEFVYPLLFPSYIGNSQYKFTLLTQIVDITGVLGLSAIIGLLNGAAYELLAAKLDARRVSLTRIAVPLALVGVSIVYGMIRLPAIDAATANADTIKVGIVQTNLGSHDKSTSPAKFMREHLRMSLDLVRRRPDVELLVWPESVYYGFIRKDVPQPASKAIAALGKPTIMGALSIDDANGDGQAEYFNSIVLMSEDGELLSSFDKVELLAFGETLPLSRLIPAIGKLFGGSWFTHGSTYEHLRLGDKTFLPTVCYEDIIPSLPRRVWRNDGPANVLVNVTNDSWYGDTHEPMIHLVLASFRSIEARRALIRSTNTGISAIVDPAGRIVERTGQWTRETLVADVPLIEDGSSSVYMRFGDVIAWIALLLTATGLIAAHRARRTSRDSTLPT